MTNPTNADGVKRFIFSTVDNYEYPSGECVLYSDWKTEHSLRVAAENKAFLLEEQLAVELEWKIGSDELLKKIATLEAELKELKSMSLGWKEFLKNDEYVKSLEAKVDRLTKALKPFMERVRAWRIMLEDGTITTPLSKEWLAVEAALANREKEGE